MKKDEFLEVSIRDPLMLTRKSLKNGIVHALEYARGDMIDLGCGQKPYRELFEEKVKSYYGVDLEAAAEKNYGELTKPDIFADVTDTKLEGSSFDTVLSTQVLEHIAEPEKFICEAARLLKREGICIMTIPMLWKLHSEPFDYYRFTEYGIRHLFEKNGSQALGSVLAK